MEGGENGKVWKRPKGRKEKEGGEGEDASSEPTHTLSFSRLLRPYLLLQGVTVAGQGMDSVPSVSDGSHVSLGLGNGNACVCSSLLRLAPFSPWFNCVFFALTCPRLLRAWPHLRLRGELKRYALHPYPSLLPLSSSALYPSLPLWGRGGGFPVQYNRSKSLRSVDTLSLSSAQTEKGGWGGGGPSTSSPKLRQCGQQAWEGKQTKAFTTVVLQSAKQF